MWPFALSLSKGDGQHLLIIDFGSAMVRQAHHERNLTSLSILDLSLSY
jgi:hypothetical protein